MSGAIDTLRMVRAWMGSGDMGDIKLANTKDILAATAGGSDLGATGTGWGDIYLDTTKKTQYRDAAISISSKNDGYIDIDADTGIRLNGEVVVADNKDIVPATDSNAYIGAALTRWATVFADLGDFTNLKFGTYVADATATIKGYVSCQDKDGNAIDLAVVEPTPP